MGKTVFFSTHILSDVAEICTRVGIIEAGKLVASGSLEDLHLQMVHKRKVEITFLDGVENARQLLNDLPGVAGIELHTAQDHGERSRLLIEFSGGDLALSQVLASLVQAGIPVLHFSEDERDLEEVFMHATKGLVT